MGCRDVCWKLEQICSILTATVQCSSIPGYFVAAHHMVLEVFNNFLIVVSLTPGSGAVSTHMRGGGDMYYSCQAGSRCNEQWHVGSLEGHCSKGEEKTWWWIMYPVCEQVNFESNSIWLTVQHGNVIEWQWIF